MRSVAAADAELADALGDGRHRARGSRRARGGREAWRSLSVIAAQSALRAAAAEQERAHTDAERYANLVTTGAVSRFDADRYRTQVALSSAADTDRYRAQLDVSRNQAAVTRAEASVVGGRTARKPRRRSRVRAPRSRWRNKIRPYDRVCADRWRRRRSPRGTGRLRSARHALADDRAARSTLCRRELQGDTNDAHGRRTDRRHRSRCISGSRSYMVTRGEFCAAALARSFP